MKQFLSLFSCALLATFMLNIYNIIKQQSKIKDETIGLLEKTSEMFMHGASFYEHNKDSLYRFEGVYSKSEETSESSGNEFAKEIFDWAYSLDLDKDDNEVKEAKEEPNFTIKLNSSALNMYWDLDIKNMKDEPKISAEIITTKDDFYLTFDCLTEYWLSEKLNTITDIDGEELTWENFEALNSESSLIFTLNCEITTQQFEGVINKLDDDRLCIKFTIK